jgi:hypothetical protein
MKDEELRNWTRDYEGSSTLEQNNHPFLQLVYLIQTLFSTGMLPEALVPSVLVLLPKPNSHDHRGIGLLEVVRKLISAIIDTFKKNNTKKRLVAFKRAVLVHPFFATNC